MVIWSQPARNDLKAIHDFIAQDSPHYARKTVNDIREKTDGLDELPHNGKVVPELSDGSVREVSRHSWRVIYEIRQEDIYILAVVHKRRNLKAGEITR